MFLNENNNTFRNVNTGIEASETNLMGGSVGMMDIALESETTWNNICVAMMRLEHTSYVEKDDVLMERGVKAFWGKVVAFFKKMIAKVKEWAKKTWNSIQSFFANSKKWLELNKAALMKKNLNGFKFSINTFQNIETASGKMDAAAAKQAVAASAAAGRSTKEDDMDEYDSNFREAFLQAMGIDDDSDALGTALSLYFRADEGVKKEKALSAAEIVKVLEETPKAQQQVDTGAKVMERLAAQGITQAEKAEAAAEKKDNDKGRKEAAGHQRAVSAIRSLLGLQQQVLSALAGAIADRHNQYFAAAKAALSYKPANVKESTDFGTDEDDVLDAFMPI
jgi:hypothetical protein